MLEAVEAVNVRQKQKLFERISAHFGGALKGRTFALWGLAFKPDTDDMREAPSRVVMEALWAAGARVQAYDPVAMDEARRLYPAETAPEAPGAAPKLSLAAKPSLALEGADALVIITEWKEFRSPDLDLVKAKLRTPVIFDGRNLYDPAALARQGFTYYAIGRGASVRKRQ